MVEGVAEAVKTRRKALGMTAADLADETAVGKPLSRAVISDLETGRKRTLDVAELATLAEALRCSPLSLLFPNALGDYEELPGKTVPARKVLRMWIDHDKHIGIAVDLARVERQISLRRKYLDRVERYQPDDDHDRLRREIKLLEDDRVRLVDAYKKAVEDA